MMIFLRKVDENSNPKGETFHIHEVLITLTDNKTKHPQEGTLIYSFYAFKSRLMN